jgi:hypothetical protein
VESPQVSGKVFRFLSAMHPALSKSERKRYAGYDPDQWYPWTQDVSTEFADLMRRAPRDTSFARGFAYVAQRAVPEGGYIPTSGLLSNLHRLPAAFRGPGGSGFQAAADRVGHARVRYGGMPGFSNVCIAIQGELSQRLQASGAQNVAVKHGATCRVNGGDFCEFELEWAGESAPAGSRPITVSELLGEEVVEEEVPVEATLAEPMAVSGGGGIAPTVRRMPEQRNVQQQALERQTVPMNNTAINRPSHSQPEAVASPFDGDLTGDDLFIQLRKRLAEADRQSKLYRDAQGEIDRLRVELSRLKAQADADISQAKKERDEAIESIADLKARICNIVADD